MNIGHVQGGTNAGWRTVTQQATKEDWVCQVSGGGCGKVVRYYWTRCPNCGSARPETEE